MIEGDIKGFFDNIDHQILAALIKKQIKDQNLIDLYWKLVNAGYVNDGNFTRSELGVPQGGVLSPLLSNIYLHEFDLFMEALTEKYSDWEKKVSRANPPYAVLRREIAKLQKKDSLDLEQIDKLKNLKLTLSRTPSVIRDDKTGNRVYFNRYADDWVVGISGDKALAQKIKQEISDYLQNTLHLELSEVKTRITHMETEKVKYLGFLISRRTRRYTESQKSFLQTTGNVRRPTHSSIIIEAPIKSLIEKLIKQGYGSDGKNDANVANHTKPYPKAITKWIYMEPQDIILRFNGVIRGLLDYYSSVENRNQFSYILWILKFSAVFTLARKLNISSKQVWKKFGNPITVKFKSSPGKHREAEGDKPKSISLYNPKTLSRDRTFKLSNYFNFDPFAIKFYAVRSRHIWDEDCYICGSANNIVIHHVKHIRKGKTEGFTQVMRQLNRKQLPVCHSCHMKIHSGTYDGIAINKIKSFHKNSGPAPAA